jgi:MFS family permease
MFPYLVLVQMGQGALVLGLIYTVATLASAGLGLLLGFASDLVGRKVAYIVSLALLPLSTALLFGSPSLPVVFLAAAVGGYSATGSLAGGGVGGVAAPIQSALMTDLTSREDRTFYFGLLAFLAGIAAALGAYVAGYLPVQAILVVATAVSSVSAVLGFLLRERAQRGEALRMRTGRTIGKFSLTGMLNGLSQGLLTPFLIPFFILIYHVPQETMGLYATISGVIASFSLLLAPRLERTLGFLGSIYATRGATVVLAIIFPFVQVLPVSLAVYFTLPSLRVTAVPVQQTAMMDMVDSGERGRAFGINQATRLMFSAAGTGFTGYEFHLDLIYVPFVLYGAVMLGNLFLYHSFFRDYSAPPGR